MRYDLLQPQLVRSSAASSHIQRPSLSTLRNAPLRSLRLRRVTPRLGSPCTPHNHRRHLSLAQGQSTHRQLDPLRTCVLLSPVVCSLCPLLSSPLLSRCCQYCASSDQSLDAPPGSGSLMYGRTRVRSAARQTGGGDWRGRPVRPAVEKIGAEAAAAFDVTVYMGSLMSFYRDIRNDTRPCLLRSRSLRNAKIFM